MLCPTCDQYTKTKHPHTPYWVCEECELWFQSPLPAKSFESFEEKGGDGRSNGHQQSEDKLEGSRDLARKFFKNWIQKIPNPESRTLKALDVGCKYPMFAHTLRKEFGMDAYGIDGMDLDKPDAVPITTQYQKELEVPMFVLDFERTHPVDILSRTKTERGFDAISMVHVFEHLYGPRAALRNLHKLLDPNGTLLLRMPSHDVRGFEEHLTPAHYMIHPYFYSERAVRYLLDQVNLFEVVHTYGVGAGVRDFLLKPLVGLADTRPRA